MSVETHRARIDRVQELIRAQGLDALLCFKPQNTYYLSRFMPGTYSHPIAVLVPAIGDPALIIWANRGPNARLTSLVPDIRLYGNWAKEVGAATWTDAVLGAMSDRGLTQGAIGIEGDYAPVAYIESLREQAPEASFVDASNTVNTARVVKDADEIAAMRDACALTDVGMEAVHQAVAARKSEIEVSAACQAAMLDYWKNHLTKWQEFSFGHSEGAVHNSFWCYALAGDRVKMNSSQPSTRIIKDGELVWVVVIAALDGQHAELERTFAVGDVKGIQEDAFEGLLRIHEEGQQYLHPGRRLDDFHAKMMDLYDKHGYGDYKPGRIGHGIGLGSHEAPQMGPADKTVLEPNMMLTYEPNLRIPEFGGLQHSDSILITEDGFEYLTTYRRDLIRV